MWKRKKFPLIHNFQEEKAFLKGASHSCSQVRRGWLVCSFTCKGRMSFVASQSYGNKNNTRLVNFKVLLFMQMPPRCLHFTFWSIQIKFWCGLGPSRNVKPNTVSIWGQDCKYPTQYCHWRFVAWQGLGMDRDHGDRARSRWNQLQTLCWVSEEQQRSPSQWGLNPEAWSTLNSFWSPRYLERSHRLREANPSSALRLTSAEKLFDLETFLCRNIPARRRVRRSLSAPVQHGKPLSPTSCKRGGGPPLCRASSEHHGRRLLSRAVGRHRRRAPLSRTAGNRSARVNYGDCRAPSLLRRHCGFRQRSSSASLGEGLLSLSGSGKGRRRKTPFHTCVQTASGIVRPVTLHGRPCRRLSQFQSWLFPFSIFPTHLGCPFHYYYYFSVPSYVCIIHCSIYCLLINLIK